MSLQVIESLPQDRDAVGQERRTLKARHVQHLNVGHPNVGGSVPTERATPNKKRSSTAEHIAPYVMGSSKNRRIDPTEPEAEKVLKRRLAEDPVGDFSRDHCLPVITEGAKHKDLKTIKHSTVSLKSL